MNPLKKAIYVSVGCLCVVLGVCGAFLPVLPTTPLLLAAAFLFSRSSQRLNDWLAQTEVYKAYVEPINSGDGIPHAQEGVYPELIVCGDGGKRRCGGSSFGMGDPRVRRGVLVLADRISRADGACNGGGVGGSSGLLMVA